jgi:hypothetical protein
MVPFAFLVTELLMVHFVGEDRRGWLLGYGPWPPATDTGPSGPSPQRAR